MGRSEIFNRRKHLCLCICLYDVRLPRCLWLNFFLVPSEVHSGLVHPFLVYSAGSPSLGQAHPSSNVHAPSCDKRVIPASAVACLLHVHLEGQNFIAKLCFNKFISHLDCSHHITLFSSSNTAKTP